MRLHDHACLHTALKSAGSVQPIFVFDTDILARFNDKKDRRLSFLAQRLCVLDDQLKARGGGMLVLHGRAEEIVPRLANLLQVQQVVAAEDFEPAPRARDAIVKAALPLKSVWGMSTLLRIRDADAAGVSSSSSHNCSERCKLGSTCSADTSSTSPDAGAFSSWKV